MARAKLTKPKDNNKKTIKPLKSSKADQKAIAASVDKSLKSLKKIKKQLKDIVHQREKEQLQLDALNDASKKLTRALEKSEKRISKLALKKDLKKFKAELEKKSSRFNQNNDKIAREIQLFKELSQRVERKIQLLEKEIQPTHQQLDVLEQDYEHLFEKINHFESELTHLDVRLSQPEQLISEFEEQLAQLKATLAKTGQTGQQQDTRLNLLQTDNGTIRKSLQQVQSIQQARSDYIEEQLSQISEQRQEQDTRINLLKTDAEAIRKSLHQIQDIQQASNTRIDEKLASVLPRIAQLDEQGQQLQIQTNDLAQTQHEQDNFLKQLQSDSEEFGMMLADVFPKLEQSQQQEQELSQTQKKQDELLQLLQSDTGTIRESLAQIQTEQQTQLKDLEEHKAELLPVFAELEKRSQQLQKEQGQLGGRFSVLEEAQKQLTAPLETHLAELANNLSDLNNQCKEQQDVIRTDQENLDQLIKRVNQFDDILQHSSDELREHIQQLRETDLKQQSEQSESFRQRLDLLSVQLSGLTDQSSELQGLLKTMQDKQNIAEGHHNELSRQYLSQQQQLDSIDRQLGQLEPLIDDSNEHKQQIAGLSDSIEQLSSQQQALDEMDKSIESSVSNLSHKLNQSHTAQQKGLKQLQEQLQQQQKAQASQLNEAEQHQRQALEDRHREQMTLMMDQKSTQLDQEANLEQLGNTIKTRSQLFGVGLVAVLAVSTILLLNQELFLEQTDKQSLLTDIKADITNETYAKINELTKQNGIILNKELNQIRTSIEQVKASSASPVNVDELQNSWHERYQLLENDLAATQTEQGTLKQSVNELLDKMLTLQDQLRNLPHSPARTTVPASITAVELPEITSIDNITDSYYVVQLVGAFQLNSIRHFIHFHNLTVTSKLYQAKLQDQPWYIVTYGQYHVFSQAQQALQNLPDELKQYKPWIRKLP